MGGTQGLPGRLGDSKSRRDRERVCGGLGKNVPANHTARAEAPGQRHPVGTFSEPAGQGAPWLGDRGRKRGWQSAHVLETVPYALLVP